MATRWRHNRYSSEEGRGSVSGRIVLNHRTPAPGGYPFSLRLPVSVLTCSLRSPKSFGLTHLVTFMVSRLVNPAKPEFSHLCIALGDYRVAPLCLMSGKKITLQMPNRSIPASPAISTSDEADPQFGNGERGRRYSPEWRVPENSSRENRTRSCRHPKTG